MHLFRVDRGDDRGEADAKRYAKTGSPAARTNASALTRIHFIKARLLVGALRNP
jgi:hypothetical protein